MAPVTNLEEAYFPVAERLARSGATRGMILQALRHEKLDDQTAGVIADRAIRAAVRIQRLRGAGILCTGLLLMGMGLAISRWVGVKIPVGIAFFGLIVAGIGLTQLFQRNTS